MRESERMAGFSGWGGREHPSGRFQVFAESGPQGVADEKALQKAADYIAKSSPDLDSAEQPEDEGDDGDSDTAIADGL